MSPINPEIEFQSNEHSSEDKEKLNQIGLKAPNGPVVKNYEDMTDEELDRHIEQAHEKQKLLEKEHIYEHENAINEES